MNESEMALFFSHRVALFLLSLVLLAAVLELVRRGLLREKYALLWLGTAAAGLVIGLFPGLLVWMSDIFKFQYLTVIFVFAFLFTLALVLSFSVVMSRMSDRNRKLAQEVALLSHTVQRLEQRLDR